MIELFGTVAVGAMALTYALEERRPAFGWAFGAACLASAGYAVLIGSWPFAVMETLWAGLAARRTAPRIRA